MTSCLRSLRQESFCFTHLTTHPSRSSPHNARTPLLCDPSLLIATLRALRLGQLDIADITQSENCLIKMTTSAGQTQQQGNCRTGLRSVFQKLQDRAFGWIRIPHRLHMRLIMRLHMRFRNSRQFRVHQQFDEEIRPGLRLSRIQVAENHFQPWPTAWSESPCSVPLSDPAPSENYRSGDCDNDARQAGHHSRLPCESRRPVRDN